MNENFSVILCGVLFVARREASEVFDPVEELLDAVTIEHWAEAGFPAAMHRRDVDAARNDLAPVVKHVKGSCTDKLDHAGELV